MTRSRLLFFACRTPNHLLRDCSKSTDYRNRLYVYIHLGEAATYLLNRDSQELSHDDHSVLQFFDDFERYHTVVSSYSANSPDDNFQLETWLADLLDDYDSCPPITSTEFPSSISSDESTHYASFSVPVSVDNLSTVMTEFVFHSQETPKPHLLLNTRAPKTICNSSWLKQHNWTTVKVVELPNDIPPFRFAASPIHALFGVCLLGMVNDNKDTAQKIHLLSFVLRDVPIAFLLGFQDQRRLGFDMCLRHGPDSQLKVFQWYSIHNLTVTSHVWSSVQPSSSYPTRPLDFSSLISAACSCSASSTSLVFHTANHQSNDHPSSNSPPPSTKVYPISP